MLSPAASSWGDEAYMLPLLQKAQPLFNEFCKDPIGFLKNRPLLVGSVVFFLSTTFVNLGNYLFNLVVGRWLGPVLFADVSLVVTLMLVATFITTALSTTVARFVAVYAADERWEKIAALRRWCIKMALLPGIFTAVLLISLAIPLQQVFQMQSFWPFVMLGVGFPIFFVLAVERGILQGRAYFGWLSVNTQGEMWTRLLGAMVVITLGWSVNGVVGVLVLSFLTAWFLAYPAKKGLPKRAPQLTRQESGQIIRYFWPVIIGLLGQILINNSDVLLVKSFFPSQQAGLYAALALIGRMVYFATWSIVVVMFPVVAQKYERREPHRHLLWLMLGIITFISGSILLSTLLFPNFVVHALFGDEYLAIAPLLWLYALATIFYTLSNGIVSYYLSLGDGIGNYLVLLASVTQVIGLLLFHQNLLVVVWVQVVIMSGLFLCLLIWDTSIKSAFSIKHRAL